MIKASIDSQQCSKTSSGGRKCVVVLENGCRGLKPNETEWESLLYDVDACCGSKTSRNES